MPGTGAICPRVSLIVINYNTEALVCRLLASAEGGADELVVVDNSSTTGSLDVLTRAHPDAVIVRSPRNLGYGAGANLGARHCSGDVLVVANPDIRISAEGLRRLAAVVSEDGVGAAAPSFVDGTGAFLPSSHYREPGLLTTLWNYSSAFGAICSRLRPRWNPTLRTRHEHASDHETVHVLGALMAIDAKVFRYVGGFDESFFLYREETDLCRRIRAAGWKVYHVAGVSAGHEGDASGRDGKPIEIRPAAVRSHYHYLLKHRGRLIAALAWLIGVCAALSWLVIGPRRASAWDCLRAHIAVGARRTDSGSRDVRR